MKTNSDKKSQSNGLNVGAGAVAGAVAGAAGTILAEPLFANQETETILPPTITTTTPDPTPQTKVGHAPHRIDTIDRIEVVVNGESYTIADGDQDGSVAVGLKVVEAQSYEDEIIMEDQVLIANTIDSLQQSKVEVTPSEISVNINGETLHISDINNDGLADLVSIDINGDLQISSDETANISHKGMLMSDFTELQYDDYTNDIAHTNEVSMPDYVNDANVNEFMA